MTQLALPGDPDEFDVRGFTFWRTWSECIVRPVPRGALAPGPKRHDNRPKPPPRNRVGHFIAIHTGLKVDRAGLFWINDGFGYGWTEGDLEAPGMILGVARITGHIAGPAPELPWYRGPVWNGKPNTGWVLDDVVSFDEPVACGGGALGLWTLSETVRGAVRERWVAARRAGAPKGEP